MVVITNIHIFQINLPLVRIFFFNFTKNVKKIKFVIKFQMVIPGIIKIWYIKNDNYRLVIKNYGLEKIFSNILHIMRELENIYKLNKYFYMDSKQNILKYKKYGIISDCEKNSSFNYKNEKDPIYCNDYKLENMINVKKLDVDKYNCLLCNKYIPIDHYFSKDNINNFENNITIKTKDSIKKNLLI